MTSTPSSASLNPFGPTRGLVRGTRGTWSERCDRSGERVYAMMRVGVSGRSGSLERLGRPVVVASGVGSSVIDGAV